MFAYLLCSLVFCLLPWQGHSTLSLKCSLASEDIKQNERMIVAAFCGCTSGGVYVPCMPGESYSCLCCCILSANSLCVAFANELVVKVWPLQKIAICLQMRHWWQHDGEFLAILQLTTANHFVTHLKLVSPAILLVIIQEIQAWGTCGLTERWNLADWVLVSAF